MVVANGQAGAGACTILGQTLVSGVTKTSTAGTYTVVFAAGAGAPSYYAVNFADMDTGSPNIVHCVSGMSSAGFTVRFQFGNGNQGAAPVDPSSFSLSAAW